MSATKKNISLCMIVKDEADHLAGCLNSVKEVVDEIIIVDTGSHDNTVSIAKSFGAKLYHHEWEDNFAIPRNISLEHAQGEWILMIDADEQLDQESRAGVRKLTESRDVTGYRVLIQLHPEWTEMRSVRLFRNIPDLRFAGVYHEELQTTEDMRNKIIDTTIKINHKPFSPEDFNRKYERNIRMLKKHISHYPNSIYQMLDLARILLETNALLEAEKILNSVNKLIRKEKPSERKYEFYLINYYMYKLKLLSRNNADSKRMLSLCKDALLVSPLCPLFMFEAAQLLYKLKSYEQAMDYFQRCLAFRSDDNYDRSIMFPRDMIGSKALSGIGYCYFRMHQYEQANQFFQESYAVKKDENVKAMISALRLLAKRSLPILDPGATI
jgi:glycosyltransferase involved in cell wall biosynthesis